MPNCKEPQENNRIVQMKINTKIYMLLFVIFTVIVIYFNIFIYASILVIAILSIVLLFSVMLKSNSIAIGIIITTSLTRVIFHLLGMPRAVPTLFTEFCVLLLLAKALYLRLILNKNPLRAFGIMPMIGILVVMLISYCINGSEMLPAIFFFRQIFIFYLFFIALQNINLTRTTIEKLNKYIIYIFLLQLPAAAIKVLIHGPEEGLGIGTVSWQAGELSTTLPLFAMSFLFAFLFYIRDKKYILLIGAYLLFGIVGQKRALALFIPVLGMTVWYLFIKSEKYNLGLKKRCSQLKYLITIGIIGYLGLFASAQLLKDEMYKGRINAKEILEYIIWYNTRDQIALYRSSNPNYTVGRFTIITICMKKLRSEGVIKILFGFGPGSMIHSIHLEREENVFEQFGIRGNYPGFVAFVMQLGFLGVILITFFFIKLFHRVRIMQQKSENSEFKMLSLGFLGATFVFGLDFFIYSQSTLLFGILTPVYYYVASIILKGDHNFRILRRIDFQYESSR